jgi:Nif-specific regulatory protein
MGIIDRATMAIPDPDAQVALERDLYRRLLELGEQEDLGPFLEESLALVVEATGARQGYLELRGEAADDDEAPWWLAQGYSEDELKAVRAAISRGIVAEALASGRTVSTASAVLDERFAHRESVRAGKIEAVLCTPIGGDAKLGVLYLSGSPGAGPFSADDVQRAEIFARHVAPFADRLLARARDRAARDATQPARARLRSDRLVGHGGALAAVLEQAALVAPLDVSVLLTGDSGTGKSALARVIHDSGPRAGGPFVELNCGALPETLVESELFGAAPGAHSTARQATVGKVAAAEGGTLLLDEVGDLPPTAQTKLLQLLQSRTYYALGSPEMRTADVRVIAATNVDLEAAVAEKRFRDDLYYRLQVVPIRMPSLAERVEDLPELAAVLLADAVQRHRLPRLALSPRATQAIASADWPGNVRQLAHALEAAAIRAAGEGVARVERRHVFPDVAAAEPAGDEIRTFQEATRDFQRELLRGTLEETGWNVTETARRLDLARSHVYNLIKSLGIEREAD